MTHPLHAQLIPAGPPIRPRLPLSAIEVNASLAALFNDPATRQQALALAADWAACAWPARCQITGNPVGTDTLAAGYTCACAPCTAATSKDNAP